MRNIKIPRLLAFHYIEPIIGGAPNLVKNLVLLDEQGQNVAYARINSREFLAESDFRRFAYEVSIETPTDFTTKAHASWIENDAGILMLRDLIPQFESNFGTKIFAKARIETPKSWVYGASNFQIESVLVQNVDADTGVFVMGKNWRRRRIVFDGFEVNLAIRGNWQFSDDEAEESIRDILSEWRRNFGEFPDESIQMTLVPADRQSGRWEAETRGNSVTIISGDLPFKKPSLQRLHEQLRHELLHLWVPNQLALTGNYSWFYEGFSTYQSLKMGVELNRLSFDDYLATISEAYRIVRNQKTRVSLTEASRTQKSGSNMRVYAEGMLIAFFCDAAVLHQSRGKRSVSDAFRGIYQKHRLPNKPQDGNIAILGEFNAYPELRPIVDDYIEGNKMPDWTDYIAAIGLEQLESNSSFRLEVKQKLSGRQKDLLDKLGYNNWRKLGKKSK